MKRPSLQEHLINHGIFILTGDPRSIQILITDFSWYSSWFGNVIIMSYSTHNWSNNQINMGLEVPAIGTHLTWIFSTCLVFCGGEELVVPTSLKHHTIHLMLGKDYIGDHNIKASHWWCSIRNRKLQHQSVQQQLDKFGVSHAKSNVVRLTFLFYPPPQMWMIYHGFIYVSFTLIIWDAQLWTLRFSWRRTSSLSELSPLI